MSTRIDKPSAIATVAISPVREIEDAGHKVLRDTYRLLSVTLLFSAVSAVVSATLKLPAPGLLVTLAGYFGLLFITYRLRNSLWGLASVFQCVWFR